MTRRFLFVVAAVFAAFVFTAQSADARHRKAIDPTLSAVDIVVGGAWTGAYFAIGNNPSGLATVGTTIGCAATAPIVATVVLNRPLKYREAHILVGSCVIPIIGGWLVNEAYNAGWLWAPDEKPVRKARHRKKKKM